MSEERATNSWGMNKNFPGKCLGNMSTSLRMIPKPRKWLYLPSLRLQRGPDHSHSGPRRKWWRSLPRSSGSTSSALISVLPHQTFCEREKQGVNRITYRWGEIQAKSPNNWWGRQQKRPFREENKTADNLVMEGQELEEISKYCWNRRYSFTCEPLQNMRVYTKDWTAGIQEVCGGNSRDQESIVHSHSCRGLRGPSSTLPILHCYQSGLSCHLEAGIPYENQFQS